jgi:hypothetical protein
MPANTAPPWSLPYPLGTDRVMDGDDSIKALADRVAAVFVDQLRQASSSSYVGIPNTAPFTDQSYYYMRAGWVHVIVVASQLTWAANALIFNIPAIVRPSASFYATGMVANTGAPISLQINPNGNVTVGTAVASNGGGLRGSFSYPVAAAAAAGQEVGPDNRLPGDVEGPETGLPNPEGGDDA